MQPEFWQKVWENNQLGFQLEQPHELLVKHAARFLPAKVVFVPLCGKSPDLHFLARQHSVVGAELSPIACHDFFAEAQLPVLQVEQNTFESGAIRLHQGDIFELSPIHVQHCQHIYDRAALIALPAELRAKYVQWLQYALPKASVLLLTVVYPQAERQGPPFSVDVDEIHHLFDRCKIQLIDEQDLTGKGFARRKLATTSLVEQAWWIEWDFA
ncbi:MAG TPA: thiopurine S-methyltransferase [Rheinheimera sp.]|nr:thiopurine S-methyltransferase [Rheinheimera sp.]